MNSIHKKYTGPFGRPAAPHIEIRAAFSSHVRQLCVIGRPNLCKIVSTTGASSWELHAMEEPAASLAPSDRSPWSEKERELLWESVPRPLMKLGQAGVQETHTR
jgi:hypothetical protein